MPSAEYQREYKLKRKAAGNPIKQYPLTREARRLYQQKYRKRLKAEGHPDPWGNGIIRAADYEI
jgi:hypothetical protein